MSTFEVNDEPVAQPATDRFGRSRYAQVIGSKIETAYSPERSLVFSINGSWGSGKTSLARLVQYHLEDMPQAWKVEYFTPWSTGSVEAMLNEYYATLSRVVPRSAWGQIGGAVKSLTKMLVPSVAGAISGQLGGGVASAVLEYALPEQNVATQLSAISSILGKHKVKALIVIDDVDRLDKDELRNLLRIVRLLGMLPGVNYLMCYDFETLQLEVIEDAWQSGVSRHRARFMEKIVQTPFLVPPLSERERYDQLRGVLCRVSEGLHNGGDADNLLADLLDRIDLPGLVGDGWFQTPRSIKRFEWMLDANLRRIDAAEIDLVDMILLLCIQYEYPHVYQRLGFSKSAIREKRFEKLKNRSKNVEQDEFDLLGRLLQGVEPLDVARVSRILCKLEPELAMSNTQELRAKNHARGVQPVHETVGVSRGLRDPRFFERYFDFLVPSGQVSESDMRACLDEGVDALTGQLSRLQESGQYGELEYAWRWLHSRLMDDAGHASFAGDSGKKLIMFTLKSVESIMDESEVMSCRIAARSFAVALMESFGQHDVNYGEVSLAFDDFPLRFYAYVCQYFDVGSADVGSDRPLVRDFLCGAVKAVVCKVQKGEGSTSFPMAYVILSIALKCSGDCVEGELLRSLDPVSFDPIQALWCAIGPVRMESGVVNRRLRIDGRILSAILPSDMDSAKLLESYIGNGLITPLEEDASIGSVEAYLRELHEKALCGEDG